MRLITPLEKWISSKIGMPVINLDALREYQLRKLKECVDYTKMHSRFYRELLSGSCDISSLAEFEKLPFTTPDDISRDPHKFLCVPLDDVMRIVTLSTSGTSGKSKRVFSTEKDQELTIDFFHHGMSTFTSAGDRVLIFMPGRSPGGVCDLLTVGLGRLGAVSQIYGVVSDYTDAKRVLLEFCPNVVVGIPSQMYKLASEMRESYELKSVLLASDYISPDCVSMIEDVWNCEVFMHYGMTETGLGGAVSCSAHAGYHMREGDLYYEIVDPVTGKNLPYGEYGEIVVTTLNRYGMPLIRYRTGDISRILAEPCPCGSVIRRFDQIANRGIEKCLS